MSKKYPPALLLRQRFTQTLSHVDQLTGDPLLTGLLPAIILAAAVSVGAAFAPAAAGGQDSPLSDSEKKQLVDTNETLKKPASPI